MHITVTDEIRAYLAEASERLLWRWALDEYREQCRFERSVSFEDAMPMTDLGEAGA